MKYHNLDSLWDPKDINTWIMIIGLSPQVFGGLYLLYVLYRNISGHPL
jgi:hypothetical protein